MDRSTAIAHFVEQGFKPMFHPTYRNVYCKEAGAYEDSGYIHSEITFGESMAVAYFESYSYNPETGKLMCRCTKYAYRYSPGDRLNPFMNAHYTKSWVHEIA